MRVFSVPNVRIKGVAAAVPATTADNLDCALMNEKERELFVKTVGIRYRKVAPKNITAADLCEAAAKRLITDLNWLVEDVSILIFITQTPDYIIPNSASLLQHKLGLSKNCIAFDVNLGCSGYVYGLSIISSLLQNQIGGKALLLVGDVSTHIISPNDKSTVPLFSDAGSATALEFSLGGKMTFHLQTDGAGFDDIIVPDGGFRQPINETSFEDQEYALGVVRNRAQMKLDGLKIFNFALREVAPNINALLKEATIDKDSVDYVLLHQANLLMLESVRKKLQLPVERVPYSLHDFGNTSSASIPVTMVANLRHQLSNQSLRLLLSGFGVGLSWGSCYLDTENICCPEMIIVE